MRKIPTLFERDWEGDRSRVLTTVVAGCGWVLEGEGVATRKYDGTAIMLDEQGAWWSRRAVKEGATPPEGWYGVTEPDPETGKIEGWEPVEQSPFAKFWREAYEFGDDWQPGTYELVGPKINGNPERTLTHQLIGHAGAERYIVPRSFDEMGELLAELDVEGFVFQHPDGRMAKIKKRDFGLKR